MFCTNCGAKQDDGARFCTNCGAVLTPLTGESAPSIQENRSAPASSAPVYDAPLTQSADDLAQESVSDSGPRKKKRTTKRTPKKKRGRIGRVVTMTLVVLAIAGACIAAFLTKGFGLFGVTPKASANDYSWTELSRISSEIAACESDEAALQMAQSYNLLNAAVIIGFRHDDKTEGGKAGISFMVKNCVSTHAMNAEATNAGGWEQSDMRSYLNDEFINRLPDDLRSVVVAVDKSTNNIGKTTSPDCVTKTSDSLWLLSNVEVVGEMDPVNYRGMKTSTAEINNIEGGQYQLFQYWSPAPTGISETMIKSGVDGEAIGWWLRTALPTSDDVFLAFDDAGKARVNGISNEMYGVSPCFCL